MSGAFLEHTPRRRLSGGRRLHAAPGSSPPRAVPLQPPFVSMGRAPPIIPGTAPPRCYFSGTHLLKVLRAQIWGALVWFVAWFPPSTSGVGVPFDGLYHYLMGCVRRFRDGRRRPTRERQSASGSGSPARPVASRGCPNRSFDLFGVPASCTSFCVFPRAAAGRECPNALAQKPASDTRHAVGCRAA